MTIKLLYAAVAIVFFAIGFYAVPAVEAWR
jgi:hypothetical protein